MARSEQINELAKALSVAQGQIVGAEKDATNPHFKSQYSTLDAIWKACRAPLADNGLGVTQIGKITEGGDVLETILMHTSGQWVSGELRIKSTDPNPQKLGSYLTYLRRYALSAIVGVAPTDDDDGESAIQPHRRPSPSPYPRTQAPQGPTAQEMATVASMTRDVGNCPDVATLQEWAATNKPWIQGLPEQLQPQVRRAYAERLLDLRKLAPSEPSAEAPPAGDGDPIESPSDAFARLSTALKGCDTQDDLAAWKTKHTAEVEGLPAELGDSLIESYKAALKTTLPF